MPTDEERADHHFELAVGLATAGLKGLLIVNVPEHPQPVHPATGLMLGVVDE